MPADTRYYCRYADTLLFFAITAAGADDDEAMTL